MDTAARVLAQQLSSAPPVCVDDRLYGGDIAAIVAEQSPATQVLMLVGHQPELESLLLALTDQPITLPTAALAALEMASWDSIGDARLLDFVTPKRLARQAEPG